MSIVLEWDSTCAKETFFDPSFLAERMTSFSGSLRWGATPGLTSLCNFAFNSGFRLQEVSTYSIWRVVIFAPIWLVRWALSQIARTLFRWTKDIKYMDYYERALVNGVLGIQRGQQPGVMIYMLPMAPGSSKARSYHGWGNKFASFWCCYGTGILFTIWVFIAFFHYFRCIFITLRPSIALAFLLFWRETAHWNLIEALRFCSFLDWAGK